MGNTPESSWRAQWGWLCRHDAQIVRRCLFRRSFTLEALHQLCLCISADSRYRAYLDGEFLGAGPAAGDLFHYHYETYGGEQPIVLQPGSHVLAIEVLAYGNEGPLNEMHTRGGLVVEGGLSPVAADSSHKSQHAAQTLCLSTPGEWKVIDDPGFTPAFDGDFFPPSDAERPYPYFWALSFTEHVDRRRSPIGWQAVLYNDAHWSPAVEIGPAVRHTDRRHVWSVPWVLEPSPIAQAEHTAARFARVVSVTPEKPEKQGVFCDAWRALIERDAPLTIPPDAQMTVVLDHGQLTTGFVEVGMIGGRDAQLRLVYAEAFSDNYHKTVRDDPAAGRIEGHSDTVIASGERDLYIPHVWRTYRFVELHVQTRAQPLTLNRLRQTFHAYPLKRLAEFETDHRLSRPFWDKSWRTLRLCAQDHFTDCPYYEQLQYAGDTLIQALMAYNLGGDWRLWRRALRDFDHSRLPIGLTQSRYPSRRMQIIPPFSLMWICMVREYHRHIGEPALIASLSAGMMQVLNWFALHCEQAGPTAGLARAMPYWNFIDWVPEWPAGDPSLHSGFEHARELPSLPVNLQLLQAIDAMREMAEVCELHADERERLGQWSEQIRSAIQRTAWDAERGLFADTPTDEGALQTRRAFSEHANVLAILTGVATPAQCASIETALHNNTSTDAGVSVCSLYFQHYYALAMTQRRRCDRVWRRLEMQWQFIEDNHLSTMPERPDRFRKTRSDCHAWSGWPAYWFVAGVLGIQPDAPAYERIRIEPQLGGLPFARGRAPSPHGAIHVDVAAVDGQWRLRARTPAGAPCTLHAPSGEVIHHNGGELIYEEDAEPNS